MAKENDRFTPRVRLVTYDTFKFYKEQKIPKSYLVGFKEFRQIAREILKVTSEHIVNKVGGVVLDGFGYIGHWRMPKKKVFKRPFRGNGKLITNPHTSTYFYITQIMTDIFTIDPFKGWTFDRAFNLNIKQNRFKKLKQGIKYKFYYSLVRNFYSDKKFTKNDNYTTASRDKIEVL